MAVQTSVKVENNEDIAGTGVLTPELGRDQVAGMACCYGQPAHRSSNPATPVRPTPLASQDTVAAGDPERLQILGASI